MDRNEVMLFVVFVLLVIDCSLGLAAIAGRPHVLVEPDQTDIGEVVRDMPYGGEFTHEGRRYVVIPD